VSAAQYDALHAILGDTFGAASVGMVRLPDLRGRFLRGADRGAGRDPGAGARGTMAAGGNAGDKVGSVQGDELEQHSHGITDPGHNHGVNDPGHSHSVRYLGAYGGPNDLGWAGSTGQIHGGIRSDSVGTGIGLSPSSTGITGTEDEGGSETRPTNAAVNFLIKY
jgi:microcystin-dependent protein